MELAVEGGGSHKVVVKHLVYRDGRYYLSEINNWAALLTPTAQSFVFPPGLGEECGRVVKYWCVQDKDVDNYWHFSEGTLLEQIEWWARQQLFKWRIE